MLVPFGAGEEMRTEISTKFLRPGLEGIYAEAGLELTDWWTDPEGLYALSLARALLAHSRCDELPVEAVRDVVRRLGSGQLASGRPRRAPA